MSIKFYRPKFAAIALAILTASVYFDSLSKKEDASPTVQLKREALSSTENLEPISFSSESKAAATEQQAQLPKAIETNGPNRSPAYHPESLQAAHSNPDFFQSGKLDLNLRYILESDPIFLEQNEKVLELINTGENVRSEEISIPAGFRVSLRLEPQCTSRSEDYFQIEDLDPNAQELIASGYPAYVGARTKTKLSADDLAKALQAENCITSASADVLEAPGSVPLSSEPLTSNPKAKAFQIMRNAGLVDLFSIISHSTFDRVSVSFGVVDTGVNIAHSDLRSIASGTADDYGHGTMVAGTAAAPANGIGTMGSMPFHVKVRSFKVNTPGKSSAFSSSISNGILRASYENIDVINVSWSGFSKGSYRSAIATAVKRGSVVTGSGGNSGARVSTNVTVPGSIIVGALNATNNNIASYSNFGTGIELYTPGTYMTTKKSGGYGLVSGTSFAAPLVGGVALMIKAYAKSKGKMISPAEVERIIMSTSHVISTNRGYVKKLNPAGVFQRMQSTLL